jgi:hypothetical protein
MIVLDGGEVFDDEIIISEHGVRTLRWNPASCLVYESSDGTTHDLLYGKPQFKNVYEEHKSNFLVCRPDGCSTRFPPYTFETRTTPERPVYLSDIFGLMRERVRTAIVLAHPGSIRDDALEKEVSQYMDDHVVFINTGCRCVAGQYVDVATGKKHRHTRSVSSTDLASSWFVDNSTANKPATKTATDLKIFGFGGRRTGRKLRKKIRTGRKLARRKYKTKTIRRKTKH